MFLFLLYFGAVNFVAYLITIILVTVQYSRVYATTPSIQKLLRDHHLQERCQSSVALPGMQCLVGFIFDTYLTLLYLVMFLLPFLRGTFDLVAKLSMLFFTGLFFAYSCER